MKSPHGKRFKGQEMILRLFAFNEKYEEYGGRLAKFLNHYMGDNRFMNEYEIEEKTNLFYETIDIVFKAIFDSTSPTKGPMSVLEATLVGVSRNLRNLSGVSQEECRARYDRMILHEEFSPERLSEGLAGKERLLGRIGAAVRIFSENA